MVAEPFEFRGDGTAIVRVHVQPAAGRTAVAGMFGDALKLKVAAPPDRGRANEACVALLAEILGVEPSQVALVSGETSRSKRFSVGGVDEEQLRRAVREAIERARGNAKGDRRVEGRR